ncbi:hypothetical protein M885DRAFT_448910 [Pelagophyceae sp. CCMP2097]|nr:hypothetical protein M885DRAFT_448910 [Pelagophyceae sp. CCMP2097]
MTPPAVHIAPRASAHDSPATAAWRLRAGDLQRHGDALGSGAAAVTYAFGGVFSVGMYGTAEAKDYETGEAYTEYILRCQWGRTFEAMQPWMVARRFREFISVDANLRCALPDLARHLPPLPSAYVLFTMAPDIVEQRQRSLEDYLRRLVAELPTTLRSAQMDEFLCISDRIASIEKAAPRNAP